MPMQIVEMSCNNCLSIYLNNEKKMKMKTRNICNSLIYDNNVDGGLIGSHPST